MPKVSAGILLYRRRMDGVEFLLIHPGGPFWKNKDDGAWSIPKGEVEPGEDLLVAAIRETHEELGHRPAGPFTELPAIQQKSGKKVHAWLCESDFDPQNLKSNTFKMEWPPKSGCFAEFPEADRAAWFPPTAAAQKINPAQSPLLAAAGQILHSES